jgi:hypothetical protein
VWYAGSSFYDSYGLNDMDLKFHAVGSGREQTASTADLHQAYPKQATEAEVPPVPEAVQSEEAKMQRLRTDAPYLAALVSEDRMSLAEAT